VRKTRQCKPSNACALTGKKNASFLMGENFKSLPASASRAIVVSENRTFVSCSLEPITRYTQLRQPDIIE